MNYWFLDDPGRVAVERAAVEVLAAEAAWLTGHAWRLDSSGGLCLDFEVTAHGKTYSLCMSYPTTFPFSPPFVRPADPTQRLSMHQYLDGTLCLEWGPDTWNPALSGTELVKSAFKLLEIENPGAPDSLPAPSRHHLTIGQESRGKVYRAFIEEEFQTFLDSLPNDSIAAFEYIRLFPEAAMTVLIVSATFQDRLWESKNVPTDLADRVFAVKKSGIIFRKVVDLAQCQTFDKIGELTGFLKGQYSAVDIDIQEGRYGISSSPSTDSFILSSARDACFFSKGASDGDSLLCAKILRDETGSTERVAGFEAVKGMTIGLVGLGSLGSKIAMSLGRSGICRFVLVDDDIVFPGNLVRHTTDWTNVGQHKVNAVADSLKKLRQGMSVKCFRTNLTAQESNAHLNTVLKELGACDIIIDATASPMVFNVLSAVSQTYSKPLIWCEIYAGGIGGSVARSRPGRDPVPQTMRSRFLSYLSALPKITVTSANSYTSVFPNGLVSVASDAEVSLIAGHTTRFAWDTLLNSEESNFAASMYLIGLAKGWIFEGPFDTIPLDVGQADEATPAATSPEIAQENSQFISHLLSRNKNATAAAA